MTGSLNCLRRIRVPSWPAPAGCVLCRRAAIVMDREHDADGVTRDILIAARRSFITPFDRHKEPHHRDGRCHRPDGEDRQSRAVRHSVRHAGNEEDGDAVVECALLVEEAIPLLPSISQEVASA